MAGARTCLVTGGAGFIGRHLVHQLQTDGHRVRVLDIVEDADLGDDVEIIRGCITDGDCVRRALAGVDVLYHVAGNPNLWLPRKSDFGLINCHGTEVVLREAARFDLDKIVFTSTESILIGKGPVPGATIDETISRRLVEMPGPYCRSKYRAEKLARAAAARGQPVVVVNPTLPVGPGDRGLTPPTRMLLGFLNGKHPAYLECLLNMNDVRDIARGHILAAEKGRVGERYILGNENIRLSALLGVIEDLTGLAMPRRKVPYWLALAVACCDELVADWLTRKPPSAPLTGVRLARSDVSLDSSKAVRELGAPQRPVADSLRDSIQWLVEIGYVSRPLPKFAGAAAEAA
jgi:dihydroflavonol-4-reductase